VKIFSSSASFYLCLLSYICLCLCLWASATKDILIQRRACAHSVPVLWLREEGAANRLHMPFTYAARCPRVPHYPKHTPPVLMRHPPRLPTATLRKRPHFSRLSVGCGSGRTHYADAHRSAGRRQRARALAAASWRAPAALRCRLRIAYCTVCATHLAAYRVRLRAASERSVLRTLPAAYLSPSCCRFTLPVTALARLYTAFHQFTCHLFEPPLPTSPTSAHHFTATCLYNAPHWQQNGRRGTITYARALPRPITPGFRQHAAYRGRAVAPSRVDVLHHYVLFLATGRVNLRGCVTFSVGSNRGLRQDSQNDGDMLQTRVPAVCHNGRRGRFPARAALPRLRDCEPPYSAACRRATRYFARTTLPRALAPRAARAVIVTTATPMPYYAFDAAAAAAAAPLALPHALYASAATVPLFTLPPYPATHAAMQYCPYHTHAIRAPARLCARTVSFRAWSTGLLTRSCILPARLQLRTFCLALQNRWRAPLHTFLFRVQRTTIIRTAS